jgi:hypothetical protein
LISIPIEKKSFVEKRDGSIEGSNHPIYYSKKKDVSLFLSCLFLRGVYPFVNSHQLSLGNHMAFYGFFEIRLC